MDWLTVGGLILAALVLLLGATLKGASLVTMLSGAAFVVVVAGSVAATMLQTPISTLRRALALIPWLLHPPTHSVDECSARIVAAARVVRRRGFLALQMTIPEESDPFLRHGLQLMIDGIDPQRLKELLESESSVMHDEDIEGARVLESMGGYAPTLGILGAVLGLMSVMQNLGDPSRLGPGIAAAFTATLYGIALANLVLLPAAAKLEAIIVRRSRVHRRVIDGLVAFASGESPNAVAWRMRRESGRDAA